MTGHTLYTSTDTNKEVFVCILFRWRHRVTASHNRYHGYVYITCLEYCKQNEHMLLLQEMIKFWTFYCFVINGADLFKVCCAICRNLCWWALVVECVLLHHCSTVAPYCVGLFVELSAVTSHFWTQIGADQDLKQVTTAAGRKQRRQD